MGVTVIGLAFAENTVELEYTDDILQTDQVAQIRRLYLNRESFSDYLDVIEALIVELVDDAELKLRNPPDRIPAHGADS